MNKTMPLTPTKLNFELTLNALHRRDIDVLSAKVGRNGRPLIEVSHPLNGWRDDAVEITEIDKTNGVVRSVLKMVIWRGSYILWR